MLHIFISYRRDDSAGYAGRLADSLETLMDGGQIFRDVEDIKPGDDFAETIEHNLQRATVLLIVIGKNWLTAKDDRGQLRLQNPKDFVRLEIETALHLGHQIIPVLIDGAVMPNPDDLPKSLAAAAYRQAFHCSDSRWDEDVNRLFDVLNQAQGKSCRQQHRFGGLIGKFHYLALSVLLLLGAGVTGLMAWQYFLPPDVSGNWYFENGSYLLIKQDGDHFQIERIDPALQTTYEKGSGIIRKRRLEFNLEPIYTDRFRYRGHLELDWTSNRLRGQLLEILSNDAIPVELNRVKPD